MRTRAQLLRNNAGSKTSCAAAVVAGGMYRSGSTIQVDYAREALRLLQARTRVVYAGYWDMPRHMGWLSNRSMWGAAITNYQRELAVYPPLWANPNVTLIYKSHEHDKALLTLCKRAAILTSHRCARDLMRSASLRWRLPPVKSVLSHVLLTTLNDHARWRSEGALDVPYELMRRVPPVALRLMARFLSGVLYAPNATHAEPLRATFGAHGVLDENAIARINSSRVSRPSEAAAQQRRRAGFAAVVREAEADALSWHRSSTIQGKSAAGTPRPEHWCLNGSQRRWRRMARVALQDAWRRRPRNTRPIGVRSSTYDCELL